MCSCVALVALSIYFNLSFLLICVYFTKFHFFMQIVYTTVCLSDIPSEPSDFFPLSVNYQERFSAAGRTRYLCICLNILVKNDMS